MTGKNNRLDEVSHQLDENILAVRGTLELVDASLTEDELHVLLLKAIERMDAIQRLSVDMFVALRNCVDKIGNLEK